MTTICQIPYLYTTLNATLSFLIAANQLPMLGMTLEQNDRHVNMVCLGCGNVKYVQ